MQMPAGSSQALHRFHLVEYQHLGLEEIHLVLGQPRELPGISPHPLHIIAVPESCRSLRFKAVSLLNQSHLSQAEVSDPVHVKNPSHCMQNRFKDILHYLRLSAHCTLARLALPSQICLSCPWIACTLLHVHPPPCVLQFKDDYFHRAVLPMSHFPRKIVRSAKSESTENINYGMLKAQGENSHLIHYCSPFRFCTLQTQQPRKAEKSFVESQLLHPPPTT